MKRPLTESKQPFESGAEDARTPDAAARFADYAGAQRLECVRFIGDFRRARPPAGLRHDAYCLTRNH